MGKNYDDYDVYVSAHSFKDELESCSKQVLTFCTFIRAGEEDRRIVVDAAILFARKMKELNIDDVESIEKCIRVKKLMKRYKHKQYHKSTPNMKVVRED